MLCELARDIMQTRKVTENVQVWVRDDLGEVAQTKIEFRMQRLN